MAMVTGAKIEKKTMIFIFFVAVYVALALGGPTACVACLTATCGSACAVCTMTGPGFLPCCVTVCGFWSLGCVPFCVAPLP